MSKNLQVLPIASPSAVRFSQSAYKFVPSATKPTQEFRASFGHLWGEIHAIIAWDRCRHSVRVFLIVEAVELGSSKRSACAELPGDFVMLLIALAHCSDPSGSSFSGGTQMGERGFSKPHEASRENRPQSQINFSFPYRPLLGGS
jgi:hypothetical protein